MPRDVIDAIIIGGGPAGAATAAQLARAGRSVAVVEKAPFPRRKVCGEFLSPANLPILRELGLADAFLQLAGPEIRRVAVFAGEDSATADMPRYRAETCGWGRALGREHLDTMLLDRARTLGAEVWQPASVTAIRPTPDGFECSLSSGNRERELRARVVVAAHGSWDAGPLQTQHTRTPARASDLFGFKARFIGSGLDRGLMPLLSMPGAYGGLVRTDHDRVTLSCCIRRDQLDHCRRESAGAAGEAVLAFLLRHNRGAREALDGAVVEPDSWRSTGPIRPGVHGPHRGGVLMVGNAAGEAHPVIAEGLSMALQSASLLAERLIAGTEDRYATDWQSAFAWRIHVASAIAHWAMRPRFAVATLPILRAFPRLLTEGARTTGKVWRRSPEGATA